MQITMIWAYAVWSEFVTHCTKEIDATPLIPASIAEFTDGEIYFMCDTVHIRRYNVKNEVLYH